MTTTAPDKSAALQALTTIERLLGLTFNPEPVRVYKPQTNGNGAALKLDLRLDLAFKGEYLDQKNSDGGLFLELVPQKGQDANGNATFDWADGKIGAKLGLADITALLVGIRYARIRHEAVPAALRAKGDTIGNTVGLFHVFESAEGKSTTAISLQFAEDGSFLRISKAKDVHRTIKLSLPEEFQVEQALLHALHMFQLAGRR